jgi:hypothetical protein
MHRSDQNRSPNRRWTVLFCYNAARNDPYLEHHHPRYTPLREGADDAAVRAAGARVSSAEGAGGISRSKAVRTGPNLTTAGSDASPWPCGRNTAMFNQTGRRSLIDQGLAGRGTSATAGSRHPCTHVHCTMPLERAGRAAAPFRKTPADARPAAISRVGKLSTSTGSTSSAWSSTSIQHERACGKRVAHLREDAGVAATHAAPPGAQTGDQQTRHRHPAAKGARPLRRQY